jgi:hypothetical protein
VTDAADRPDDDELLAELFDQLLQDILEGRTPDLDAIHPDRPDLRERIARTWRLACSVAGRREPSRPVLGGYEIVRELGHGGMGTVYLARHQSLQRDVAIKVLPRSLAMSPHAKRRFLEEARALAQIRHENVVHIHRIVDHAEMLAFEMEFVAGPSLQALLARLRQSPRPFAVASLAEALGAPIEPGVRSTVEWFVRLFIRLARALEVVHAHGIVHRDIKPSNVLLRPDGSPALADFGLALHADLDATRTRFAGTPVYAAPERLRGGDAGLDARADVYSLGVTLYEALSTNAPFAGHTTHEILQRIETASAPSLRACAPHVPRDLAVVVQKAMEPDPRRRYATAAAFADDLERLLALQPIQAAPAGALRRGWQFVLRNRRLLAAAAAGALAVAAVVWPLAAHAANERAALVVAATERAEARRLLLSPEALPTAWSADAGDGRFLRHRAADGARADALHAALRAYGRASAARADDRGIAAERAAVAAAAALVDGDAAAVGAARDGLPPLARRAFDAFVVRRAANLSRDDAVAAAAEDRLAAGLLAFLHGDEPARDAAWADLPDPWSVDPFVEACTALATSARGRAYARLFHAARSVPGSAALAYALAEAALADGDVALARQWLDQAPAPASAAAAATLALLRCDVAAAEGDRDAAAVGYRQLAAADPADPRPILRLAQIALRAGDRAVARRMLESMAGRWPLLGAAHRELARLALEERDLPGYLARVRIAVSRLDAGAGRSADELVAILRLGGLHGLADRFDADGHGAIAHGDRGAPLQAWLPASAVRALEQGALLWRAADEAMATASAREARADVAAMMAPRFLLLRAPGVAALLPPLALAACVGVGELGRVASVQEFTGGLAVFQQALGSRMRPVADPILAHAPAAGRETVFANHAVVVPDLDGDTLPEIALTCPPTGPRVGNGCIELRSLADGALLRTWRHVDPDALFARGLTPIGDIDGDQCDDLAVGLPAGRRAPDAKGAVEAWSGRTGAMIWRVEDAAISFGAAIAAIGDVDGDGARDLAVGVPPMRLADDERGAVALLCGRTGAPLRRIQSPFGGRWFGAVVTAAGDVDGDGHGDLAVAGNFGGAPGLVAVYDARTGAQIAAIEDGDAGAMFGAVVAAAGDLDGDGRGDLFVSAAGTPRGREASDSPGSVFAISGRTGKSLYELRGDRPGEGFGVALAALPDWRGDGRPAVAVSTLRGGPNGGGYVRVFDAGSGAPLQTIAGTPAHARFGYTVFDLGDRDADGLRELGIVALLRNLDARIYAVSQADANAADAAALSNAGR